MSGLDAPTERSSGQGLRSGVARWSDKSQQRARTSRWRRQKRRKLATARTTILHSASRRLRRAARRTRLAAPVRRLAQTSLFVAKRSRKPALRALCATHRSAEPLRASLCAPRGRCKPAPPVIAAAVAAPGAHGMSLITGGRTTRQWPRPGRTAGRDPSPASCLKAYGHWTRHKGLHTVIYRTRTKVKQWGACLFVLVSLDLGRRLRSPFAAQPNDSG